MPTASSRPAGVRTGIKQAEPSGAAACDRTGGKPAVVAVVWLGVFLLIQSFVPLRTAIQIGADEGFEVAKVTLSLHGYKLYREVWNDQPPLHTFLLTQMLRLTKGKPLTPPDEERTASGREEGVSGDRRDALSYVGRPEAPSHYPILWPRLVTTAFTCLLLMCVFGIVRRRGGLFVGALTVALLIASPGFVELSSSCMLEIPSLAVAIAGLCVLTIGRPRIRFAPEFLGGVLFGIAALMKLVPLYLLPLAGLIVWLRQRETEVSPAFGTPALAGSGRLKAEFQTGGVVASSVLAAVFMSFRSLLLPGLIIGVSLVGSFVLLDFIIEGGAFLIHFQQSWASHFGGVRSFEHGSPADHAFDWAIFLKNWDVTLPAVLGMGVLISRLRQSRAALIPLAWLALSLVVFTNHKPWWPYYYIHSAIPLCWCAAVGIEFAWASLRRNVVEARVAGRKRGTRKRFVAWHTAPRWLPLAVFALCAGGWMAARVYLQVANIRTSPRLHAALVLKEIEPLKPFARWLYTDQLVYSFHAGVPMPPPLAVVPLKRLWAGDMTRARVLAELSRFKPEIILLGNATPEFPLPDSAAAEYRLIYQDERLRLYAHVATIKQADAKAALAIASDRRAGE